MRAWRRGYSIITLAFVLSLWIPAGLSSAELICAPQPECTLAKAEDPPPSPPPPPPNNTGSCESEMMDPHWSSQDGGGVKAKARFRCGQGGVNAQATVMLFYCGSDLNKPPSGVEANWESEDGCIRSDPGRVYPVPKSGNTMAPGVWYDENYYALKNQPIQDGWYVACVITYYVQSNGGYQRGPTANPSWHPAYCRQSLQNCANGTYRQ